MFHCQIQLMTYTTNKKIAYVNAIKDVNAQRQK